MLFYELVPGHLQRVELEIPTLAKWNSLWRLLVKLGFAQVPGDMEHYKQSESITDKLENKKISYFDSKINSPKIKYYCNEFSDLLRFMNELEIQMSKKRQKTQAEWSYIGTPSERYKYFGYLNQLFWTNQDNESIKALPTFNRLLEKPWLMLKHMDKLDINILPPFSFFSARTGAMFNSIEKSLSTFTLSPFLLYHEQSSFNWNIVVEGVMVIKGYTIKDESIECNISIDYLESVDKVKSQLSKNAEKINLVN